jgi:hypothetical protein
MASLWPWLAVAAAGALHGLNPATGWMWAACWGLRSGDLGQALRALVHSARVAPTTPARRPQPCSSSPDALSLDRPSCS